MKTKLYLWLINLSVFIFQIPCFGQNLVDSLKVVTFNLYGAPESEWPDRQRKILDELQLLQPDLIALQEAVETPEQQGQDNRAKILADSLYYRIGYSYNYLFERTHFAWSTYDEGIAILTRHIILDSDARALPPGIFERKVLWAKVLTPFGIVNFFDTHLSYGNQESVREAQVNAIKEFVAEKSMDPIAIANIVCGDFNAVPNSSPIRMLTNPDTGDDVYFDSWAISNPGQPGYTVPSDNPTSRIDYIFLRNDNVIKILNSKLVFYQPTIHGNYPSDHIGVLSTFQTSVYNADINIISPRTGDEVSGETTISWTYGETSEPLTVIIYLSNDAGKTWYEEWTGSGENSSYLWNTLLVPDGTRYMLRIAAFSDTSFGIAQSSGTFTVNNPGNVSPELEILSPRGSEKISGDYLIKWFAADADGDSLNIALDISIDNGINWQELVVNPPGSGSFEWDTQKIANSPYYKIKLSCSDGSIEVADTSRTFEVYNEHPALPASIVRHVSGIGTAIITVQVIDSDQLTGDVYRITFNDTLFENKIYNIVNVSKGENVVENATQLDGVTEGPLFDGLRLLIKDFDPAEINFDSTGWVVGSSTLDISIYLPEIDLGTEVLYGFPHPADYKINIYDHVVDTSSATLGAMEVPMKFSVWNLTENKNTDIIFIDLDADLTISRLDEIYFLEPDELGELRLTWTLFFSGLESVTLPLPGDEFVFRTLKPVTSEDVYEFSTTSVAVDDQKESKPAQFVLLQNYPNPFNPLTTIQYNLAQAAFVTLKVYNMMGQEVKILVNKKQYTGQHYIEWDGTNNNGKFVSTGIYFYKINAKGVVQIKKMLLMK